ncbi:acyl carrier protein [Scytonema sp. UIC 10036]|uniref:acyl carrier protein n=1 Tax=Scytonema sp. UIC 10036 TaxID=2304196 RepID=UPI00140F6949|nr:acyl carrier protein [Scytonema sp. UIC 10036]
MYESKLRQAIAEALEVAPEVLAPDASSDTIEAWDSLKHLDVILNIERSYNVKFKTSEIAELVSVARIEDALRQHNAL